MRSLLPALLLVGLTGVAFGQGRNGAWSLGGFGSVVYPGLGHAPGVTPPVGYFGRGAYGFSSGFANPGRVAHGQHGAAVIVPYPVYYGGYYGYDPSAVGYGNGYGPAPDGADGYPPDGSQPSGPGLPSVVINQNFVPPQVNPQVREYNGGDQSQPQPQAQGQTQQSQSGMKLYQAPPTHPYSDAAAQRAASGDQPTIYLIALNDHTVVQALGYWMEGSTLHYVSAEHTLNQVSIDLVDRGLSQRLNDERGLDFRLPPAR